MIETENLTREFDDLSAVDRLNLRVEAGQLYGLVGPDGAGKTTTLRLLAGLLKITEGEAWVGGHSLREDPESIKPLIGYMAQEFSLYAELTVDENLQFFASLYDMSRQEQRERSYRLLEFAGLTPFRQRKAADLSGGMKKKLALACTLVHQPKLLLLDEPTTGVDPVSRREFWEILTELNVGGTTILVTTPYMDEADRCQQVGLMYQGELVISDEPATIRQSLPGDVILLRPTDWRQARAFVAELKGVLEVQTYGESLHLIVDDARQRLPQLKQALEDETISFNRLEEQTPRMEEAFISLIRRVEAERREGV